jgi:hypothetical protein
MSAVGYPDYQRITQWLGAPLVQGTGLVIGAGTHTDGPLEVANFASVIVALKATTGNVTVTIKQTVPGGPAALVLTETVIVPAGATLFETFVLFGQAVELDLTGSVAGTSVDYALYGSNTTTNAQVITAATINVQHNDVLLAAEPTLDFEDGNGVVWTLTDDGANTRMKVGIASAELAYVPVTAPITVSSAAEAAPTVIAATPAIALDGATKVKVTVSAPMVQPGANDLIAIVLSSSVDGALGRLGFFGVEGDPGGNDRYPMERSWRGVPSAGNHVFTAGAWRSGTNGVITCGTGAGLGTYQPAYIEVTRI